MGWESTFGLCKYFTLISIEHVISMAAISKTGMQCKLLEM
jgi:hypothetical protein